MEDIIREEGGSNFTLQVFVKEIKRKLLLIIAIALAFTAVGGVFGGFIVDTKYTSTASVILQPGNEGKLEEAQSLASALKSVTDPENDALYQDVFDAFNAKYPESVLPTVKELKESISVSSNAMLLNFKVVSKNSKADLILEEFLNHVIDFTMKKDVVNGIETYKYPLFANKVDIISDPSSPTSDASTKVFKYMALFLIIGAVGSMCFILVSIMLEDTYPNKASFERDFTIDVLASIGDVRYLKTNSTKSASSVEEV